jgi:hypothetical protein
MNLKIKILVVISSCLFIVKLQAQNVGIGTTNPTAKLHVSGNVKIDSAYTLELGAGLASKEPSAGKIGYATFTPATLDIVGAGNSGLTRKMKFWNEGGANFNGRLGIGNLPGFFAGSNMLTVNGIADISQALGIGTFNPQATLDVNGNFKLQKGIAVNNISSDITLSPGNDSTLPTQNAVKQYIKSGTWAPTPTGNVAFTISPKDVIPNNLSDPQSVFVQGNYAYVASAANNRLCIYDISDPTAILPKTFINTNLASPQSVYVKGNYAYVASAANNHLCIFDISNVNAIVAKGFISSSLSNPQSVFVQGNYAYVASANNNNLSIYNISNPNTITLAGISNINLSSPKSVYVQGSYAYVASSGNNSLCVFDISTPSSISFVGSITTNLANPQSVFIQGNYAYVASVGNNKLCVFDVSNPASIVPTGFSSSSLSNPVSVYVQGKLAYVASSLLSKLSFFDVSDPSNIVLKGTTSVNLSNPQSVFALGDFAYAVSQGVLSIYAVGELSGNHAFAVDPGGNIVVVPSLWQTDGSNLFRELGNVGIGTISPTAKLHIAGDIKIDGKTLELGAGIIGKEVNAGKIGYQLFTPGTLDITGAGTSTPSRKIKFWNEGGADFMGKVGINGNVGIGAPVNSNRLNVAGNGNIDSLGIGTVDPLNRLTVVGKANIDSLGIGIATPSASFDVNGTALFRGGNTNTIGGPMVAGVEFFTGRTSTGTLNAGQTTADIAFDYGGTDGGFRHFISTRHNNAANSPSNSIDFYINNSSSLNGSSAPGTGNVLSLSVNATGVIIQDTLFVAHIQQEPIILATLLNGWVNNGGVVAPVSFYKDREERVYLSGTMRNGSLSAGFSLLQLPVGYRPAASEFFSVHNNNTTAQIRIDPNGAIVLWGPANNTGLSLSGVSFRAAN